MKRSRYRDAQLIDLPTEQRMLLLDPDHLQGPGRDADRRMLAELGWNLVRIDIRIAALYLVSSVSNAAKSFR